MEYNFEGKSSRYIQAYTKCYEQLMSMHQPHKRMMSLMYFPNAYFCQWIVLHDDLIQGAKDAFYDILGDDIGGFEPEFENDEGFDWWWNLSADYFEPKYSTLINEIGRAHV